VRLKKLQVAATVPKSKSGRSPKQLVWVNAILGGYQCLTSPVYQFITEKYALCLSWGQPTPGGINGFVASKPGENQELIAVHCGKFGPM